MVYKLGFTYMRNRTDTEDVVQEVFLRLVRQQKRFESDEHVKAWLIVTTSNYCKSQLTHWWSKRTEILDILLSEGKKKETDIMKIRLSKIVKAVACLFLFISIPLGVTAAVHYLSASQTAEKLGSEELANFGSLDNFDVTAGDYSDFGFGSEELDYTD